MPDPATPWRQADLCVVDLETTGLDPATDEIIAFATVPVSDGRVQLRAAHHRLVRPGGCRGRRRFASTGCAARTSPAPRR